MSKKKKPLKSLRMNPVSTMPDNDRTLIFYYTDGGSIRTVGEVKCNLLHRIHESSLIGWLPIPKFPKKEKH